MAICSTRIEAVSRSKGDNIIAAAAYRRAAIFKDNRLDKVHDYSKKQGLIYSDLSTPNESFPWVEKLKSDYQIKPNATIEKFWNEVDSLEKRKDSQLARNLYFALPIELNASQNIALMKECMETFTREGMIADWSIHLEVGNPHAHVLLTMREITENGFGKKVEAWNDWKKYKEWRFEFADITNRHLALNHIDARIDPRSYKEQGIDLRPTKHIGKRIALQEARGIKTERLQEQRDIQRENLQRIKANPSLLTELISRETSSFTTEKAVQVLSRYANPHDGEFSLFSEDFLNAQHRDYAHTVSPHASVSSMPFASEVDATDAKKKSTVKLPSSRRLFKQILDKIQQHDAVFSENELARIVAEITPDATLFARAFAQIKVELRKNTTIVSLGIGDDGREKFTTKAMFKLENTIQKNTETLATAEHATLSKRHIARVITQHEKVLGKTLTPEQHEAVLLMTNRYRLSALVGRAGSGKSFTIAAVKKIYESAGFNVQAIAPSGVVANALRRDSDMKASTIASFQLALENGTRRLTDRDVIVMDEAGMVDTASMHFVLKAVKKAGAKLITMGDPDQLPSVGPGATFRAMLERLQPKNKIEIIEIFRQKETWQKEATQAFARGNVEKALTAYHARGFVHLSKTDDNAMNQLVHDWQQSLSSHQNLSEQIVIAFRNQDVQALNKRLRQTLVENGHLSEGYQLQTKKGMIQIAKGERLLCLENDAWFKVSNGHFGTVTHVDFLESGDVRSFSIRLDGEDKDTVIKAGQYKSIDYGYAATVHKTQGATKDHSFTYIAGSGWDRALAYVAMTRHRLSVNVYAVSAQFSDLVQMLGRLSIKDSVLDFPLQYARRRGIEPSASLFNTHLVKRLSQFKEHLRTHAQKLFNPKAHQQSQQQKAHRQAQAQKREAAVIVAQYADVSREVGRQWSELQATLKQQGIDAKHPDFQSTLNSLPAYAAMTINIKKRDALAAEIFPKAHDYTLAIELNRLDIKKLEKQAATHVMREKLTAYQAAVSNHSSLLAQKLAFTLSPDIKRHYNIVKTLGIDTAKLSFDAKMYHQRLAKRALTRVEREAFDRVLTYQSLLTQSVPLLSKLQALYQAELHPEAGAVIQNKLNQLSRQKSAIAAEILKDRDLHAKGLDYLEIGKGVDRKRANKRWFQLQQAASFYERAQQLDKPVSPAKENVALAPISVAIQRKPQPAFIDLPRLKADLNDQAESIALHYLGIPKAKAGGQLRFGDKKGSLFVTIVGKNQGHWYDFQTAEGGDMLSLISHTTGKDFKASMKEAVEFLGGESRYLVSNNKTREQLASRQQKALQAERLTAAIQAKKMAHVHHIAEGTQSIQGTLAEQYLREHRGIKGELNSDNLRFHPALKNWVTGDVRPALVILAHDKKNQLSGLQATFLDPLTANKAHLAGAVKLSRGSISQGSVVHQAVNPLKESPVIALAEGLETALSIAEARPDWQVNVTFGVSNFERVARSVALAHEEKNANKSQAHEGVASVADVARPFVIICADNDGIDSGTAKAVKKTIENLRIQGITAQVIEPTKPAGIEKWDFNDLLKKNGVAAVKRDLDQTSTEKEKSSLAMFTEEQTHKYEVILKKFHQLRKEDPDSDATHRQAYRMAELPNIKRYVEIKHPNDLPLIQEGYKKHIQRALKHLDLSSEKIDKFDVIIKKYETLKKQYQANLSDNKAKEALQNHATKMSQLTRVMAYLQYRHPQYPQEVRTLARSHEKDHDIDR